MKSREICPFHFREVPAKISNKVNKNKVKQLYLYRVVLCKNLKKEGRAFRNIGIKIAFYLREYKRVWISGVGV